MDYSEIADELLPLRIDMAGNAFALGQLSGRESVPTTITRHFMLVARVRSAP